MCISCLECISKYWAEAFKIYVFLLRTKMPYGKYEEIVWDSRLLTNGGLHFQMINGFFPSVSNTLLSDLTNYGSFGFIYICFNICQF